MHKKLLLSEETKDKMSPKLHIENENHEIHENPSYRNSDRNLLSQRLRNKMHAIGKNKQNSYKSHLLSSLNSSCKKNVINKFRYQINQSDSYKNLNLKSCSHNFEKVNSNFKINKSMTNNFMKKQTYNKDQQSHVFILKNEHIKNNGSICSIANEEDELNNLKTEDYFQLKKYCTNFRKLPNEPKKVYNSKIIASPLLKKTHSINTSNKIFFKNTMLINNNAMNKNPHINEETFLHEISSNKNTVKTSNIASISNTNLMSLNNNNIKTIIPSANSVNLYPMIFHQKFHSNSLKHNNISNNITNNVSNIPNVNKNSVINNNKSEMNNNAMLSGRSKDTNNININNSSINPNINNLTSNIIYFDKCDNTLNDQSEFIISKSENFFENDNKRIISKNIKVYDSLSEDDLTVEKSTFFVIHPKLTWKLILDFFNFISFVYVALYTPIDLINYQKLNYFFFGFEMLLDLFMILDVFFGFFTGYFDFEENYKCGLFEMINNYLSSFFVLDFICAIPFYSIFNVYDYYYYQSINDYVQDETKDVFLRNHVMSHFNLNDGNIGLLDWDFKIQFLYSLKDFNNTGKLKDYYLDRKLKLLKLLRFSKAVKLLNNNEFLNLVKDQLKFDEITDTKAFKFSIYYVFFIIISHILTCIFIFLGTLETPNWILNSHLEDTNFFTLYIASLYFNHTTIFTVGYGDITTKNLYEKAYNIILMIVGLMLYSFTLSAISELIQRNDEKTKQYSMKKKYLEQLNSKYYMSRKLYYKISKHLKYEMGADKTNKNILLNDLPISLRNEVILNINKDVFQSFNFFKNSRENHDFIIHTIMALKPTKSSKKDILLKQGEFIEEVIFVKRGYLDLEVIFDFQLDETSISVIHNQHAELEQKWSILDKIKNEADHANKITSRQSNLKLNKTNTGKPEELKANEEKDAKYISKQLFDKYKILSLRQNEHFGDALMIENKRSPITIETKSKTAEIFLMNKSELIKLIDEFSEIVEKILEKSYFNLEKIETYIATLRRIHLKKLKLKRALEKDRNFKQSIIDIKKNPDIFNQLNNNENSFEEEFNEHFYKRGMKSQDFSFPGNNTIIEENEKKFSSKKSFNENSLNNYRLTSNLNNNLTQKKSSALKNSYDSFDDNMIFNSNRALRIVDQEESKDNKNNLGLEKKLYNDVDTEKKLSSKNSLTKNKQNSYLKFLDFNNNGFIKNTTKEYFYYENSSSSGCLDKDDMITSTNVVAKNNYYSNNENNYSTNSKLRLSRVTDTQQEPKKLLEKNSTKFRILDFKNFQNVNSISIQNLKKNDSKLPKTSRCSRSEDSDDSINEELLSEDEGKNNNYDSHKNMVLLNEINFYRNFDKNKKNIFKSFNYNQANEKIIFEFKDNMNFNNKIKTTEALQKHLGTSSALEQHIAIYNQNISNAIPNELDDYDDINYLNENSIKAIMPILRKKINKNNSKKILSYDLPNLYSIEKNKTKNLKSTNSHENLNKKLNNNNKMNNINVSINFNNNNINNNFNIENFVVNASKKNKYKNKIHSNKLNTNLANQLGFLDYSDKNKNKNLFLKFTGIKNDDIKYFYEDDIGSKHNELNIKSFSSSDKNILKNKNANFNNSLYGMTCERCYCIIEKNKIFKKLYKKDINKYSYLFEIQKVNEISISAYSTATDLDINNNKVNNSNNNSMNNRDPVIKNLQLMQSSKNLLSFEKETINLSNRKSIHFKNKQNEKTENIEDKNNEKETCQPIQTLTNIPTRKKKIKKVIVNKKRILSELEKKVKNEDSPPIYYQEESKFQNRKDNCSFPSSGSEAGKKSNLKILKIFQNKLQNNFNNELNKNFSRGRRQSLLLSNKLSIFNNLNKGSEKIVNNILPKKKTYIKSLNKRVAQSSTILDKLNNNLNFNTNKILNYRKRFTNSSYGHENPSLPNQCFSMNKNPNISDIHKQHTKYTDHAARVKSSRIDNNNNFINNVMSETSSGLYNIKRDRKKTTKTIKNKEKESEKNYYSSSNNNEIIYFNKYSSSNSDNSFHNNSNNNANIGHLTHNESIEKNIKKQKFLKNTNTNNTITSRKRADIKSTLDIDYAFNNSASNYINQLIKNESLKSSNINSKRNAAKANKSVGQSKFNKFGTLKKMENCFKSDQNHLKIESLHESEIRKIKIQSFKIKNKNIRLDLENNLSDFIPYNPANLKNTIYDTGIKKENLKSSHKAKNIENELLKDFDTCNINNINNNNLLKNDVHLSSNNSKQFDNLFKKLNNIINIINVE